MKKNKNKAFTLIESMVVLFIIGLLSFIGAIGFGKVNRQKMVQQAAYRISTDISANRDYSIFGKPVSEKYPCGYGISLKKGGGEIKNVYTSGTGMDRVSTMEANKTCDELIENKEVELKESVADDPNSLSLEKTAIEKTQLYQGGASKGEYGCLVLLYSAPRGKMFYCTGSASTCPPVKCTFQIFSESGSNNKSDFFSADVMITEGNNSERSYLRIYPSGNSETILE